MQWYDRIKHLNKGVGALDGWAIGGVSDNPLMFISFSLMTFQ
jgi:hypothetical protein